MRLPCEPLSTRISGVNRVFLGQDYGVAVLAWPRRSVCTVSGLSPGLLAKSRRYWAVLQKGCPEARVNRAFQRWVPGSPLSTRVSEHMPGDALSTRGSEAPLGKAFGNARQRFLCLSRIHLTFATALLRLAVLLVLFAACRLVSKINSLRYSGATLYKINTVVLPRKPLFQRARACSARQRTAAPPSPQQ